MDSGLLELPVTQQASMEEVESMSCPFDADDDQA
jgi:hypothetical protein